MEDKIKNFINGLNNPEIKDDILINLINHPDNKYFETWLLLVDARDAFYDEGFIPIEVFDAICNYMDALYCEAMVSA